MNKEDAFKVWDYSCSSGGGSDPDYCADYIKFVNEFIKSGSFKNIADIGCGDFRVGKSIDYGDAVVTGVDASRHHVERLQNEHSGSFQFKFVHADIRTFDCSGFDLVLMKDVMQHWPNEDILHWLSLPRAGVSLITNDDTGGTANGDIPYELAVDGQYRVAVRGLDLQRPPFSVVGQVVHQSRNKTTLLVKP